MNVERLIFRAPVALIDGCWNWPGATDRRGYGKWQDASRKMHIVPRLIYQLFCNPDIGALHVCHRCDNPRCYRPSHLFEGTRSDNMQDAIRKGRFSSGESHWMHKRPDQIQRGEQHARAKLTTRDVLAIREKAASGQYTRRAIGLEFGVSRKTVDDIVTRQSWQHV